MYATIIGMKNVVKATMMNASLMIVESKWKYLPKPPQSPPIFLSLSDLNSFFAGFSIIMLLLREAEDLEECRLCQKGETEVLPLKRRK